MSRTFRLWLLVASLIVSAHGVAELRVPKDQQETPAGQTPRLVLDTACHLPSPVRVIAEDLVLQLEQGVGFVARAGGRPVALVLVGRGTMRFSPPVRSEQRQLQLLSGAPALTVEFDTASIRLHPDAFDAHVNPATCRQGPPTGDALRRAQAVFAEERSGSPALDDLVAEVHTRRFGRLTYLRLPSQPEDVALLDRDRTLVVYPSSAHRAAIGFSYGDEYGLPYEVLHYDIEASLDPDRLGMAGRTRIRMRALEPLETVRLRLDHGLVVSAVRSADQGAHEYLQEPASNALLVRLVPRLSTGVEITLEVAYAGTVKPQGLAPGTAGEGSGWLTHPDRPDGALSPVTFDPLAVPEAANEAVTSLVYSNRVYWFPQSPVRNHTTATLRVEVPASFLVLASAPPEQPPRAVGSSGRRAFTFRTDRPVRYMALLAGRLTAIEEGFAPDAPWLHCVASPRLIQRARTETREVADIVRFFSALVGDLPFSPLTLALVEAPEPEAHSPAYLSIVGEPLGWNAARAGDDPAYFSQHPEFFLAHEVAHQWWGQAVGWRNYREQWLSEGFAQYFAALYLRHARGEEAFASVLGWMHRWAAGAVGKGAISLGIRAGQIAGSREHFGAIVYDRGAYVLHMLKGLMGDETFFRGLRMYLERWRFRRAGTDDFRRVMEEVSGLDLARFFDQWVRDDGQPELRWTADVLPQTGQPKLRLTFEQIGETFDLPLTVRIDYADRPSAIQRIRLSFAREEREFDLTGTFRGVRLNDDLGALCSLRQDR